LSDIAATISDRTRLIDAYNAAVANVNKAVDDADNSLRTVSETQCCDLASFGSQLAVLQVCFVPINEHLFVTHAEGSCGGKVFTGVCLSVFFSTRYLKN